MQVGVRLALLFYLMCLNGFHLQSATITCQPVVGPARREANASALARPAPLSPGPFDELGRPDEGGGGGGYDDDGLQLTAGRSRRQSAADAAGRGEELSAADYEEADELEAARRPPPEPNGTATQAQAGDDGRSTSGRLLDALFSHIDKQWKFAEIILIIVISAILNLVTIVGNIMVLISFKMDRS